MSQYSIFEKINGRVVKKFMTSFMAWNSHVGGYLPGTSRTIITSKLPKKVQSKKRKHSMLIRKTTLGLFQN